MNGRSTWRGLVGIALAAALTGCANGDLAFFVTNDDGELEQRMRSPGLPVVGTPLALTLVAEADAPVFEGNLLQATSVVLVGDTAVMTYNTKGDARFGGVETFRIDRSGDGPEITLTAQAVFPDTEIHSAAFDGEDTVVCAGATDDPAYYTPSMLAAMDYTDGDLWGGAHVGLDSYAATGSVAAEGTLLATTGDTGSLLALDPDSFELLDAVSLDDARWVDAAGDRVAVVQGTPGRLALFSLDDGALVSERTVAFPGADVVGSKSTVTLAGRRAFVAAGPAGTQVIDVLTGEVETEIPLPSIDVPEEFLVTNAAAVSCDYAFLSNGGGGVWLAGLYGGWDGAAGAPADAEPPPLECPRGGAVPKIEVSFGCDHVAVSSCKDLSNVVIGLEDGRHVKFDGLSGQQGVFHAPGGERIVKVWVKAGSNASGEGPGYGQRYDAPEGTCEPAPPPACPVEADHLEVELLGGLQFDGPVSVNHIAWDGEYLFVAAGKGGLKVVRVDAAAE